MKTEPRSLGMRRDRIVFQRRFKKAEPSTTGRAQLEWQDIGPTVACDLIPLRSGDEVMAGRIGGVTAYRLRCWYHPDLAGLTTTDRAVDASNPDRKFKVMSVLVGPERDFLDVVVQEGSPT